MANLIVGQSGGPTAVINSSLAGVFSAARNLGVQKIYGMKNGIKGFLRGDNVDLSSLFDSDEKINLLKQTPASYLGSCRYKLPDPSGGAEIYTKIFNSLDEMDVKYFLYIGGNDSMDTIKKLSDYGKKIGSEIRFMGVPKTIDNDLAVTDHSPGFGSAAKFIATAVRELVCDCRIYDVPAVTIIEIMGRNAGWLSASAALAKSDDCEGADFIYLPEKIFDVDDFLGKVENLARKKGSVVVAASEGIKVSDGRFVCELASGDGAEDVFGHRLLSGAGKYLEGKIKSSLGGIKCRAIELSTLQRCASHIASLTDVEEAFMVGYESAKAAFNGETGRVAYFERTCENPYRCEIRTCDVSEIANIEKKVPTEWICDGYVTDKIVDYIRPLIQGEVPLAFSNGLPKLLRP